MEDKEKVLRWLVVHFSGGTEITIRTPAEPSAVFDGLSGQGEWLIIEDEAGERHYLSVRRIAYLTFGKKKGIGFS
jgi:hypothetical protein